MHRRGTVHEDQLEEAIIWLRRSTEANPELSQTFSTLASACILAGYHEDARAALSGGGKSTLAKRSADLTQLPLYEEYLKAHADLRRDEWIIDGFGCVTSAWERFSKPDTLVYILPLITHCWWVTKRLIKSLFVTLEGWPENSPMWSSTVFDKRLSKESDRTGGTDAHAYERQEPGQQRQRQVRQRRPGAEVQAERAPP